MRRPAIWLLCCSALWLLLPLASGGVTPIAANPYSVSAAQAYAVANSTQYSVVESLTFTFDLNVTGTYCFGHGCVTYSSAWGNITNGMASLGATLLSSTTTLDSVLAPPSPVAGLTFRCDRTAYPYPGTGSFTVAAPCYLSEMNFTGTSAVSGGSANLTYSLTHSFTFRYVRPSAWLAGGSNAWQTITIASLGSSKFYAGFFTTTYDLAAVTFAVGLPKGSWNLGASTVFDQNNSSYVSGAFVSPTSLLLQWADYPSGSATLIRSYTLALTTASGNAGTKNNTAPNGTYPPGSSSFPQSETLTVATFSGTTTPGVYLSTVQWTNHLGATFNGTFYLMASWMWEVNSSALSVNGAPLTSSQYALTNTSLVIFPGAVNVTNGTTVEFEWRFSVLATTTLSSAFFTWAGIAVTLPIAFLAVGFTASGVTAYLAYFWGSKRVTFRSALALALLVTFGTAVMVL
ncbi:MAG: hypothetical protein KGI98_14830 [Euryarchaeota archaeon]|nr:hypothetical protein [Euryarchaeota archaeon]MDE1879442.1 hypothetical protein [Euryarchaeota archaeon]